MATVLKPTQALREMAKPPGRSHSTRLLTPGTVGPALKQAFIMLRPDIQWKNPVMFVVEVGAFLTLAYLIQALLGKSESQVSIGYFVALDVWLFLTVLFANFATGTVTQTGADGKSQTSIQPVKDGSDIQSNFFDMWHQENPNADLQDLPGDW